MTTVHSGRLELTWTNKHKTLLAHEDQSYEWVEQSDYRVSEIRLLHDVAKVGDTASDSERAADNLLIHGDALHALNALTLIPEFGREYLGKVKLVYIDPPFNTGQAFEQYDDALEHSVWLTMLRDRLVQIKELLSSDGSVWVHLDDAEEHRARMVLDEVFGVDNFVAAVVWRASDNSNNDAQQMSDDHNTLLVYASSPSWTSRRQMDEGKLSHFKNPDGDPRGPHFDGNPLNSPNPRENLRYKLTAPNGNVIDPPPNGWRWARETLEAKMEAGEIRWRADYSGIFRRTYLGDHGGLPPSNLWTDLAETGHNRQAKYELKTLFPDLATSGLFKTPKPERLLKKIIEISTAPGDIVLDCYVGSGTTAAVAHKLGRRWVASEWSAATISKFTLPRMNMVVSGQDQGGVSTADVPLRVAEDDDEEPATRPGEARSAAKTLAALLKSGSLDSFDDFDGHAIKALVKALRSIDRTKTEVRWSGGGGFRVLEVGPSMFEEVEGRIYLADWAVGGALGEAVAAQLGYEYEPDGPFSGRKGKTRLAVVDGLVNEGVIRLLVDQLPPNEKMLVCGTAVDPDCRTVLRALRPGSTMKKVPASILDDYRIRRRDRLALASTLDWVAAEQMIEADIAAAKPDHTATGKTVVR